MSVNYAAGLSDYPHKGKCGLPEIFDSPEQLDSKIAEFVKLVREAKHIVFHTGAGVSTSAGIPDFRGPKGVWTLEEKGETPQMNITFDDAKPSLTHMALVKLVEENIVQYIVTQNVDGLHLKSGLPRSKFSELHGNMFVEKCDRCESEYIKRNAITTVGLKRTGRVCDKKGVRGHCRGKLRDTILDWEDALPYQDLVSAEQHSKEADLSVCLGTSLQIQPSGNLPVLTVKNGGKLVIVNLQKTRHDKKAHVVINNYVDKVMEELMDGLGIPIPNFTGKPWWSTGDTETTVKKEEVKDLDTRGKEDHESAQSCPSSKRKKGSKKESVVKKEHCPDPCDRIANNSALQFSEGYLEQEETQGTCNGSQDTRDTLDTRDTKNTVESNGSIGRETQDQSSSVRKRKTVIKEATEAYTVTKETKYQ